MQRYKYTCFYDTPRWILSLDRVLFFKSSSAVLFIPDLSLSLSPGLSVCEDHNRRKEKLTHTDTSLHFDSETAHPVGIAYQY